MSKSNGHISDDLLVKYLVGEATPAETDDVEAWLAADEANHIHYANSKGSGTKACNWPIPARLMRMPLTTACKTVSKICRRGERPGL
jgi:anti-sigma factor RsiW